MTISAPGAVDRHDGITYGDSALNYIHRFSLVAELKKLLRLDISIESDAKCAALAEMWKGKGRQAKNFILVVIGLQIGGAIINNHQIMMGEHLYAGEFGWIQLDRSITLSELGRPVQMARRYSVQTHHSANFYTSQDVFKLTGHGDMTAQRNIDFMSNSIATGLYNLSVVLDPELILIGGGISARNGFVEDLAKRTYNKLRASGIEDIVPNIKPCKFFNSSNLIGAIYNFEK